MCSTAARGQFYQQIMKMPNCVKASLDGLRKAGLPE
jgi:hypothetical protein